jgi:hypothetical protein
MEERQLRVQSWRMPAAGSCSARQRHIVLPERISCKGHDGQVVRAAILAGY